MNLGNAKKYAVYLLAKRDYTEQELRDKLRRKEYEESIIKEAIDIMKSFGYIDDLGYAKKYVKYSSELKKYGLNRIRAALIAKGIDREMIDEAISGFLVDESEQLLPLIEKKLGDSSDIKQVNKIKRHFFAKGYRASDINACLRKLREGYED